MRFKKINSESGESLVKIERLNPKWNPSWSVLEKGIANGWLSVVKGQFILHTVEGDKAYNITDRPNAAQKFFKSEAA